MSLFIINKGFKIDQQINYGLLFWYDYGELKMGFIQIQYCLGIVVRIIRQSLQEVTLFSLFLSPWVEQPDFQRIQSHFNPRARQRYDWGPQLQ